MHVLGASEPSSHREPPVDARTRCICLPRAGNLALRTGVEWAAVQKGSPHWHENDAFVVLCNSTPEVGRRYADFLAEHRKLLDRVLGKHPKRFAGKSSVYIFRNAREFYHMTHSEEGVGGFFFFAGDEQFGDPKYSRLIAAFHGAHTYRMLAREATLQYESVICEGTPKDWAVRAAWWKEGLAGCFGDGVRRTDGGRKLELRLPRDRLSELKRLLAAGGTTSLKDLVRAPDLDGSQASEAWGLCHYFLHRGLVNVGEKRVDLARTFERFTEVAIAKPPEELPRAYFQGTTRLPGEHYAAKLEELLGVPVEALEDDYRKYFDSLALPSLGSRSGDTLTSEEAGFEVRRPSGGTWTWRGEDDLDVTEAIRMENARTAVVSVRVEGNATVLPPEDAPEREYEDAERRYLHAVVATPMWTYHIVCGADRDRFDENRPDFERIIRSFKRLPPHN